jgi:class 3 adenylate cyclase
MTPRSHDAQKEPSDPDPDPVNVARRLARENDRLRATLTHLEQMRDTNARALDRVRGELDALLLNVFPQPIIDRLNAGETLIADWHDDVTVLFSDLVGFTEISSRLPVAELVADLNDVFSSFDESCDRFGVEKIKTIGDAYLAVAGLPGSNPDHAAACADLALAMAAAVRKGAAPWRIRIGMHRGSAIAGVIGRRKYVYDVWGDTVNVASRLETSSEPGRIHVSAAVAERLREAFAFEPRGTIDLKGKGQAETYFLLARSRHN